MLGEADICVFDLRRDLVGFAWGVSPIVPQQCNSSNLERSHRAKAYFCEYSILIFCRKTQFKTSFRLSPFKGTKVTMPIFSLSTMSPFPSVQIRFSSFLEVPSHKIECVTEPFPLSQNLHPCTASQIEYLLLVVIYPISLFHWYMAIGCAMNHGIGNTPRL